LVRIVKLPEFLIFERPNENGRGQIELWSSSI
jgi:hypothetical protein